MKILSAQQTRDLDAYTIEHEPIASIDLMERASDVFTDWFSEQFPDRDRPIRMICGMGNNGGDGLAVARLLHARRYDLKVSICRFSQRGSEDFETNLARLQDLPDIPLSDIRSGDPFPAIDKDEIIIDAVFGSGLNRPVEGYWARLFEHLNQSGATIVSIDIPSGLFADQHTHGATIEADRTLTFELPKLAFLFPENFRAVGAWNHRSIGLSSAFIEQLECSQYYVDKPMARRLFRRRHKFDHKGVFGHALLVAGSYGKVGAAILSARAALRSGLGLLTIHAPRCAYEILQISVPEAMVSIDRHRHCISEYPALDSYQTVAIGPGIGQGKATEEALLELIEVAERPLVIDADGLNLLAKHPGYLAKLPPGTVFTPHPKEFERLFGPTDHDFARWELQRKMAEKHQLVILLKGAHTCIALPDGTSCFNSTGNPGMATAGSGDVLTGIITGLLAQQYTPAAAATLGVYVHGLAGDLAARELEHNALVAGDLIRFLGKAFMTLQQEL